MKAVALGWVAKCLNEVAGVGGSRPQSGGDKRHLASRGAAAALTVIDWEEIF